MMHKTTDSQFIQQHLANERTFLAWVRTAIAMVGLGFLASGVVFQSMPSSKFVRWLAAVVGIGAVVLGVIVITCATIDYFKKRAGINASVFRSPKLLVWATFVCLGVVNVFLLILVMALLFS